MPSAAMDDFRIHSTPTRSMGIFEVPDVSRSKGVLSARTRLNAAVTAGPVP
jgi:hypothetical protein